MIPISDVEVREVKKGSGRVSGCSYQSTFLLHLADQRVPEVSVSAMYDASKLKFIEADCGSKPGFLPPYTGQWNITNRGMWHI
jgi:hypothetical protein